MQMKKLDPRLRRLDAAKSDTDILERATGRGELIASDDGFTSASLTKRVLVELTDTEPPEELYDLNFVRVTEKIYTATVPLNRLSELNEHPSVKAIEAGRRWFPMLDSSLPETGANVVHAGLNGTVGRDGTGVLVGIIDFGMDFTLDDFRNEDDSTRIAYLWDQGLPPAAGEASPANFRYGTEYDRTQIDQALGAPDPFSIVRHQPSPASHGTHVAGTAAGNGRSSDANFQQGQHVGAAPGATMVFVQADSRDQASSFTDSSNVADAVAYVMEKAEELGLPCVINMSLGQNGGSHDGESIVERAIDRLLEPSGRAFVSAAGNEHVWRGHASGTINTGETRALRWKTGGGMPIPGGGQTGNGVDRTPSEMEVWYSSHDRFRVTVTAPDGTQIGPVDPGNFADVNGVYIDSERFTVLNGQARIYIELEPPSHFQPIQSGVWTVELEALEGGAGKFDAWIERDVRDDQNNYADQSFFMGSDFEPTHTLGTPATNRRAVAVANYSHMALAPNSSSSRGPTRDNRNKPEVAAPGTNIFASHALGGRSDGEGGVYPMRARKTGTSMAAPHVTGIIALLLEEEPSLSAVQITNILSSTADNPDGTIGFDIAWGYGRVNAVRALKLLRDPNQPGQNIGMV